MLSGSQLDAMRTQAEDDFDVTANVRRSTLVSDGAGGWTETWSTAHTNAPCRVRAVNTQEVEMQAGGAVRAVMGFKILFEWDKEIRVGDRINVSTGDSFEVTEEDSAKSDNLQTVVIVKRIEGVGE